MAATVRIARVTAATFPAASAGRGTSTASRSTGVQVRIAGVTAQTVSTAATVRIADVTAVAGASQATVRIADVTAFTPQASLVWDGTQWVAAAPAGTAASVGRGRSAVSGSRTSTSSNGSIGKGRSSITATVAFTGTLALSGGGTLSPSGGPPGSNGKFGTISLSGGGALGLVGSALVGPPGAGSLTVVADPLNEPPRILLALTGFLGTTVTINRIDESGNQTPVRLANPAVLSGGAVVLYDYEAPYNQTVRYVATTIGPTVTSDPVELTVPQSWLVHPGIPDLSQPITIRSIGDKTRPAKQGTFDVIGRSRPLIRTDGARRAPSFDVVVKTATDDQYDGLETLLDDSSVLLLQVGFDYTARTDYMWVSIGDVTDSRRGTYNFADPAATWTLPCTVTDAPSGLLQSQRTLADVAAEFSTLGDISLNYATMRDIATDTLVDA